MGEARRNKERQAAQPRPADDQLLAISSALRKVVGAVTEAYGKDCLFYAFVAAEILRRKGFDARAVAGTASWRVGSGDGDVISHAIPMGPAYAQSNVGMSPVAHRAGMFHAWVECGEAVIDFTTHLLGHKAKLIDAMDGQVTNVEWSPPYLWAPKSTISTHAQVARAPSGGVYSYLRSEDVERHIFSDIDTGPESDVLYLAALVEQVLSINGPLEVIGLGGAVPQNEESARFMSNALGLIPIDSQLMRPRSG